MCCLLGEQQLFCDCFAQEKFFFEKLKGFTKDQLMHTVHGNPCCGVLVSQNVLVLRLKKN